MPLNQVTDFYVLDLEAHTTKLDHIVLLEYAVLLLASIYDAAGHQVHWLKHVDGSKNLFAIFFVAILHF